MLAFIDDINNIKVYTQVRKMRRITITYSYGKCIISGPYKLKLEELKNIYYKNIETSKKYAIDFNNLYLFLYGNKYKLQIYNSSNNLVYIDNNIIYCATKKIDINYIIKLLKEFYINIIKIEINKIKDKVLLKFKDIFNIDLSNILIDYKFANSYLGCNNHKKITMSGTLAKYDPKTYEYVLAHEYIHEFVFNHGDEFYNKLLKVYPDYLDVMHYLKKKGKEFSFSII